MVLAIFHPDLNQGVSVSSRASWSSRAAAWQSQSRGLVVEIPTLGGRRARARRAGGVGELQVAKAGQPVARFSHTLGAGRAANESVRAFLRRARSRARARVARTLPETTRGPPTGAARGSPLLRLARLRATALRRGGARLRSRVASTAAGLIPPYHDDATLDRVLVPGATGAFEQGSRQARTRSRPLPRRDSRSRPIVSWLLAWGARRPCSRALTERMAARFCAIPLVYGTCSVSASSTSAASARVIWSRA
jgi:hypothetical protein